MIDSLPWDSDFFNMKIGKIENANLYSLEEILAEKKKFKYELLYLFSDIELLHNSDCNIKLVDQKVTYHKKVDSISYSPINTEFYNGDVNEDLEYLAILSGQNSRFKIDENLNNMFETFYKTWLKNSLNRKIADEVIIAKEDSLIVGLVTVKKNINIGSIGIIAVNENIQGRGIGKKLLLHANNWYNQENISECTVVTQLDNVNACKFYEKFGYSIRNIQYIYHLQ